MNLILGNFNLRNKILDLRLALLIIVISVCSTFNNKIQAQTYGTPLFTEDFGTVPTGTANPANYRGDITGRGVIGNAYWLWPATCSGTGWLSQSTPTQELSSVQDTLTLPARESGVTNWYFVPVTELTSGTPFNTGYINNPANLWCLYQQKSSNKWSWKFSGPNTACPTPSTTIQAVRSVRWYNIKGTWKLGNYQRDWYKYSVSCSSWHAGMDDGGYALSPNPDYVHGQDGAWFSGPDHTGNTNGLMLVVNAAWQEGQFYKREISGLCYGAQFEFKSYYANILKSSSCGGSGLPINIRYEVWDKDPGDNEANAAVVVGGTGTSGAKLLALTNTGDIAATSTLKWNKTSLIFNVPQNQDKVFIVLRNNTGGGCGNDLAIDDITFSPYVPFTIGFNAVTTNYCSTGTITLQGSITSGTIPAAIPYVFQWQSAVQGTSNWTNIGSPITNFANASIVLNIGDIGNKIYRIISAASVQNFNNSNCYVASSSFNGNSIVIPTGSLTSATDVCGDANHTAKNATFTVNYQGNVFPWTFYYKINGGTELSQIVNSPNTSYTATIPITDNTTITLTKITISGCTVQINAQKTIAYSIGSPTTPIQITGPNPACIGTQSNFSLQTVPGAILYTWQVTGDWQIISGQGTNTAKLKIGSTPIAVTIQTSNACGNNSFTSGLFQTTNQPPAAAASITAPNGICFSSATGSTDILFTAANVSEAQNYIWSWDSPVVLGTQQSGTGQYLQSIVLSVPNNISSFNVGVVSQNDCGNSAMKSVTFTPSILSLSASAGTILIHGGNTTLTATANGGTGNLQYSINGVNYQNSNTFTINASGSPYNVTVKDANNCTATAIVSVTEPAALTAGIGSQTNVVCNGGNTGSASVTANGGVGPYTYLWSNGQQTAAADHLSAGSYTVTVTDKNGATATANVVITQPLPLSVLVTSSYSKPNIGNVAVKGCNDVTMTFNLPKPALNDTTITFTIGGTAINGQDYPLISNSIIIHAGKQSASFTLMPYLIGLTPGDLTFFITVNTTNCIVNTYNVDIKENL